MNSSLVTCHSPPVNARRAFTLVELTIVLGIIIILSVLAIPAITSRSSANQMTKATDTITGVLDRARSYAQANNTYVWVGFFEEDASQPSGNPAIPGTGRLVVSIVASKDGTNLGAAPPPDGGPSAPIDATKLSQVGSLLKIDNVHLPLFTIPTGVDCSVTPCDTFDARPPIQNDGGSTGYNDSRFGELNSSPTAPTTNTLYPFQYPVANPKPTAQYNFVKTIRFSPTGENRINSTYDVRSVVEIGLVQTRAAAAPTPFPAAGQYSGNVVAVQVGGLDGSVKVYKR